LWVISDAIINLSRECFQYKFKNICQGGASLLERYSAKKLFQNKSLYCDLWKELFVDISCLLIKSGYSKEKLLKVLAGESFVK